MAMSIRGAERSEGIARRAEQAVQRCTAERRKPFGGNLAEGDPKDAQAGARPMARERRLPLFCFIFWIPLIDF